MLKYNPLPYSNNRLLVLDWASIAQHDFHALKSKKNTTQYNFQTADDELFVFKNSMFNRIMSYIKMLNPVDVHICLEGTSPWRSDYYKEYYSENCTVHWDESGYYVRYDNFLKKIVKHDDAFEVTKLHPYKDPYPQKFKKLGEMPERVIDMITKVEYLRYKGKRAKKSNWDFIVDKSIWKSYIKQYAKELAPAYRATVIEHEKCEGDDVVFATIFNSLNKYDDIVLITGDGDFTQLLKYHNVKIYDHRKDNMVDCDDPVHFLEHKILSGDSGDNINGIALPNKATQVGDKDAVRILSESNSFQTAISQGWDKQWLRNRKLIDLHMIPENILSDVVSKINCGEYNHDLMPPEYLFSLSITEKLVSQYNQLKNEFYFCTLDREYAMNNSSMFKAEFFDKKHYDYVDHNSNSMYRPQVQFNLGNAFHNPLLG